MPMRLSKLKKLLKRYGIFIEPAARHFIARRDNGRGYTIPAYNADKTEVPDVYLKGLCAHFEIDPSEVLQKKKNRWRAPPLRLLMLPSA